MNVAEELLLMAVNATYGVAIQSNDIEHLRRHLQQAKKKFLSEGHEAFAHLSFRTSPDSLTELWIVKKGEPDVRLSVVNGSGSVEAETPEGDRGGEGSTR